MPESPRRPSGPPWPGPCPHVGGERGESGAGKSFCAIRIETGNGPADARIGAASPESFDDDILPGSPDAGPRASAGAHHTAAAAVSETAMREFAALQGLTMSNLRFRPTRTLHRPPT